MRITSTPPPSQSVLEVSRNMRAKHFENRVDLSAIAERLDTFESRNPSSRIENIMYDQNGAYLNIPESGKIEVRDGVSGEGELQKLHEGLKWVRPTTEEEAKFLHMEMELTRGATVRYIRRKFDLAYQIRRYYGDSSVSGEESIEELFDMYDKQFGTNSKNELNQFAKERRVSDMLSAMSQALSDAAYNYKNSDSIMDYSDGSFSRADFDYVMGMANSFDYFGSREVTDKSTVNTTDPNVNSDLKDIAMDLFG